jgi:endonuclease/exonuclease/phosphatase family metal-dependent hydrolase
MRAIRHLLTFAVVTVVGCGGSPPSTASTATSTAERASRVHADHELTFMTRNLYLGANLDAVSGAQSLPEIMQRASEAWAQVKATNFPERAQAIAGEIARTHPDLVGLQEAALWRLQSPGDFLTGNFAPNATIVVYDFLDILLRALEARGLDYVPVAISSNLDAELPTIEGADVRLTDRDVILARAGLQTSDARSGHYAAMFEVPIGLVVPRGWVSVVVDAGERPFRFLSTHLEGQEGGPGVVQVEQAKELVSMVTAESLPVVLVGDLNSRGDDTMTPTHHMLLDAGMTDTWLALRPNDPGFTDAQAADLLNPISLLFQRLDHVLFRGAFEPEAITRVGASPRDRTPSGLWPSDHAGVVGTLEFTGE